MYRSLGALLEGGPLFVRNGDPVRNAMLEAWLLHAQNLIRLFATAVLKARFASSSDSPSRTKPPISDG